MTVPDLTRLEDLAEPWTKMCGSCDAGLPMSCSCPGGDPRALIGELLDALLAAARAVERVRELHAPKHYDYKAGRWTRGDGRPARTHCATCTGVHWPCPTVAALDGSNEE